MSKSYFQIQEEHLKNELDLLQAVKHPTTKGGHLEDLLLNFLQKELPKKYSVSSGFIIGLKKATNSDKFDDGEEKKCRSKEIDIVIFDEQKNIHPLRTLRKRDFFVESVYAAISVKTLLNKNTFAQEETSVLKNLISAKEILPHSFCYKVTNKKTSADVVGGCVPASILSIAFAYRGIKLETIRSLLESQKSEYPNWRKVFPEMIVVLGKGIIYSLDSCYDRTSEGYKVLPAPENTLEQFLILLLSCLNNRDTPVAGLSGYINFYKK